MEANVEIDITAIDMLFELSAELASKNITFALARVKQDLYFELERAGFIKNITEEISIPHYLRQSLLSNNVDWLK